MQCGKLICEYKKEEIINIPNATAIYANINGHICVALDFPPDFIVGKMMWVKEGTVCGNNKVGSPFSSNKFLIFYTLFSNPCLTFFS